MSHDGSSGGVIHMAVITEDKVEWLFVPDNELPKFWVCILIASICSDSCKSQEGKEVLGIEPGKVQAAPREIEV